MNAAERFKNLMAFKPVDRIPIIEWAGYWDKTVNRWYSEGLPKELTAAEDIRKHFDLDQYLQLWTTPRASTCPEPARPFAGILKDKKDYEGLKKHLYLENSFDKLLLKSWGKEQASGQAVIWFTLNGFFWHPRVLFGVENHMYAFFDKSELMQKMNEDLLRYNLSVLDEICDICQPSFMTFAEDMSYNHGPMLSKHIYDKFIAPYYKQIVPELKKRGIIPFVDSDGNVAQLIPWLKEVGVEGILPLERMAGVDIAQIRKDHPNFKMIGGFDKTIMHLGREAIRKEFERLLPVMKQGGYIPSVDHQTPPEVSLSNYYCYLSMLREYAIKAAQ